LDKVNQGLSNEYKVFEIQVATSLEGEGEGVRVRVSNGEGEGVRVSRATIIMISFRLKNFSDGLDAVLVQMIEEIIYKVRKSDHRLQISNKLKTG